MTRSAILGSALLLACHPDPHGDGVSAFRLPGGTSEGWHPLRPSIR